MNLATKICLVGLSVIGASKLVASADAPYRIAQFLDPNGQAKVVVIDAGKNQGVVDGALFEAYRGSPANFNAGARPIDIKVTTGQLKAFAVFEDYTLARVTVDSTPAAKAMFPKFSGVMAGDWVREKQVEIAANKAITPKLAVAYGSIFVDPHPMPSTFEISRAGEAELKRVAAHFAQARVGNITIVGHTDRNGPSETNQVESYQRAVTVRQYLIGSLGFDPNRVVAIGMGEAEPQNDRYAPGYRSSNRRIEFKVISDNY